MANDLLLLGAGPSGASTFDPASIPGLKLWLAADDGLVTDGAAQFTAANSEYLSIADNASLSTGDVDFWVAGWVYLDSKAATRPIAGKWANLSNLEYVLQYDVASDRFKLFVTSDGAVGTLASLQADSLGSPSTGAWYFVLVWHDATGNTLNIKVNNGTTDSLSHSAGIFDSTSSFNLGRNELNPSYHDGRLDSVAFGKSPPGGIAAVISTISSRLYNAGSGLVYSDLTASEKTNWGLVSWWNLNELSGTRNDAQGTNHLTDNNTVTYAAGVASGTASADGDPVSQWTDRSGQGNHLTQATASKRPTLKLAIQNGKPVVRSDGVDDFLALAGAGLDIARNVAGLTIVGVVKSSASGTADSRWLGFDTNSAAAVRAALVRNLDSANAGKLSLAVRRLDADSRTDVTAGASSYADGTWDIEAGVFDFASNSSAIWKNGSSVATGTTGGAGSTSNTASSAAQLGAGQNSWFAGDIGEVLVYQSALSTVQIGQIFTYLNSRWGVY